MKNPIPFDSREGFIFHNGEFLPWEQAKIHILTHALHYGSSCFEGIRIYNGKIFKILRTPLKFFEKFQKFREIFKFRKYRNFKRSFLF